jgi:eukaryotic-like serine/threonine-protein kinase
MGSSVPSSWRSHLTAAETPPTSSATKALVPGALVTPNVRLVERIGGGGMGTVWVAEHLTLRTRVAVKFVSDELPGDDPDVRRRFGREALAAAQVKSSHVVQVHDSGVTAEGRPYIVMELLDGHSLGRLLDRDGPIGVAETAMVLAQTGKALDAAHKAGIVHRDIKPDNVFLVHADEGVVVKVLDFGIAKHPRPLPLAQRTVAGMVVGTPEFMSPEQLLNAAEVDAKADLWSLAVVSYLCLTGELPFTGAHLGELCKRLLEGTFVPPSALRSELPPPLDAWFSRALSPVPSERFGSGREMARAFVEALPPGTCELDEEIVSGRFPLPGPADADRTFAGSSADGRAMPHSGSSWSLRSKLTLVAVAAGVALAMAAAFYSGAATPETGSAALVPAAPPAPTALPSDETEHEPRPVTAGSTASTAASEPSATASGPPGRPAPPRTRRKHPGF